VVHIAGLKFYFVVAHGVVVFEWIWVLWVLLFFLNPKGFWKPLGFKKKGD